MCVSERGRVREGELEREIEGERGREREREIECDRAQEHCFHNAEVKLQLHSMQLLLLLLLVKLLLLLLLCCSCCCCQAVESGKLVLGPLKILSCAQRPQLDGKNSSEREGREVECGLDGCAEKAEGVVHYVYMYVYIMHY